jgi:cell wall assembly regulator SMI1
VMSGERLELLRRSWSYIVTWCEAHAPVTAGAFRPGADEAALTAAQEHTGREWPAQLLAWLRLADGVDQSFDSVILPAGFAPLGVEHIVESWEMMTTIAADVYPGEEVDAAEREQAGSRSSAFLRSWLPVASDFGGDWLFIDLRGGDRTGCVGHFWKAEGFVAPAPRWNDLAGMLENLANTLRNGRWVDADRPEYDLVRVIEDGALRWKSGPTSEWTRANPPMLTPDELRNEAWMLAKLHNWTDQAIIDRLQLPAELMGQFRREWDREAEDRMRAIELEHDDDGDEDEPDATQPGTIRKVILKASRAPRPDEADPPITDASDT